MLYHEINERGSVIVTEHELSVIRWIHGHDPMDCDCPCHHDITCQCGDACHGFTVIEKFLFWQECDCGPDQLGFDLF